MFAVTVTFTPKPNKMDAFLQLVVENAQTSLDKESGCQQFDVCVDDARETVFLYEIYDDKAAFDAHLESAHFKSFDAAVADLIAEKTVAVFTEVLR